MAITCTSLFQSPALLFNVSSDATREDLKMPLHSKILLPLRFQRYQKGHFTVQRSQNQLFEDLAWPPEESLPLIFVS